ncbi:MAG: hypothetical protein GXY05_07170 [Clostridiales bacterium]|nr:hypothetical protein [Clostridiales bacterium]
MSYIFIDVEAARRCALLLRAQAEKLQLLLGDAPDARVEAFFRKLGGLADDLSKVTEAYAAEDERLKEIHLTTGEGGRLMNG